MLIPALRVSVGRTSLDGYASRQQALVLHVALALRSMASAATAHLLSELLFTAASPTGAVPMLG